MPRAYFIAFKDTDTEMVPVRNNGRIAVFDTLAEARDAAGMLGVGAYVPVERVYWYCRRFKMGPPDEVAPR